MKFVISDVVAHSSRLLPGAVAPEATAEDSQYIAAR